MSDRKCVNCNFKGEVPSNEYVCPVCGDNLEPLEQPSTKSQVADKDDELDLNKDGVVDEKDASIAGRTMSKFRRSKK